jgi:hypothetical protein
VCALGNLSLVVAKIATDKQPRCLATMTSDDAVSTCDSNNGADPMSAPGRIRPDNIFGNDDDALLVEPLRKMARTKRTSRTSNGGKPPRNWVAVKTARTSLTTGGTGEQCQHVALTMTCISSYHSRSDGNVFEIAGRQDGQQKSSNDTAAALAAIATPKLTQATSHIGYLPWTHALTAYTCSLKIKFKVLNGVNHLSDSLAAQTDTHDITLDSRQKESVYTGIQRTDREEAYVCNNWLVLAQCTSNALCKIYLGNFSMVDAAIPKITAVHAGDVHAVFIDIKGMFKKPSGMQQRRLIMRFFGGLFDANKGLNILFSQIDNPQARVNSMGVSLTLKLIIKNINDI